jgi:hypothetical protein
MVPARKPVLWTAAAIAAGGYFLVAYWLTVSYVPASDKRIVLPRPFIQFEGSQIAAIAYVSAFGDLADSADNNERSPVLLYEDDVQLGPAHSTHTDIAHLGKGRFSHWRNVGVVFIFSSSDDSNPMTNGRTYSAVMPDLAPPAPK